MKSIISQKSDISIHRIKKEKLLAKKFFPACLLKMKYLINFTYKIHPKIAYLLTLKLLSITGRKKLSANSIVFYKKGIRRKINIDSATFHTFTYGSGPCILMLHGWCSNGARWKIYVNELVNLGYSVMVVDAPGHGTAPGRFLSFITYAKGIKAILKLEKKWHGVITHSIAGLTAIAAIVNSDKKHHPSKFIMMNTFANATTILQKFSHCLGLSDEVVKYTKKQMSNHDDFPLSEFNICKYYNAINAKGLLIYDIQDKVVPKREAEHIINAIKPLQTMKTKGFGHNLKSNTVLKAVVNFIKSDTIDVIPLNSNITKVPSSVRVNFRGTRKFVSRTF